MNCPYCAEEIKDDAVVCRHCGRDFGFTLVKPILERLKSLEEDLAALRAVPADSVEATLPYGIATFVAVSLCVIFTSGYLLVSINPPLPEVYPNLPKIFAIVFPPTALGIIVGAAWKRGIRSHLFSGLALGLLNLIATWFMVTSFEGMRFRWFLALGVFALGQPVIFAVSAMTGGSLRGRFGRALAKSRGRGEGGGFEKVTKKFSSVLELLTKVVTLVAAIVGTAAAAAKLFGGAQP